MNKSLVVTLFFTSTMSYADSALWFSIDSGVAIPFDKSNYDQQLSNLGLDVQLDIKSDLRFSGKIGIGYDFKPAFLAPQSPLSFGAQFEYLTLGSVDVEYTGTITGTDAFYDALEEVHPETIEEGVAASMLANYQGFSGPLAPVTLTGRLGATAWQHNYELLDNNSNVVGTDSRFGISPTFGGDISYAFNRHLEGRVSWNYYAMDQESAQAVMIGLKFRPFTSRQENAEAVITEQPAVVNPVEYIGIADLFNITRSDIISLDVLANDEWAPEQAFYVDEVSPPEYGGNMISQDKKSVLYMPPDNSITSDTFMYWVSDGANRFGPFRVDVTIDDVYSEQAFVLFDHDSAIIKPESLKYLERFYTKFTENPNSQFIIIGHTDSTGTDEENNRISYRRAEALKWYLVRTLGIFPENIQTYGEGEFNPIATNETDEGRASNRRAEIKLLENP